MGMRNICNIGDTSNHGGVVISSATDGTVRAGGGIVCVQGAMHACPIMFHGVTPVYPATNQSYVNGKLIITTGAVAGCGAVIIPPDRRVYVE